MEKIDLAVLDTQELAEEGVEFELAHPVSGEPLGVFIKMAGADSRCYRRALADAADQRKSRRTTPALLRQEGIGITARCTLAWRNVALDGADLPCDYDNARKLYSRFDWIREQADAAMHDRANFIRN